MALKVVLYEPEIPWNTGNIGRTCVAAGAQLHLIGKLGFSLSEWRIRRSGLDYWPKLKVARHADFASFKKELPARASVLAFSAAAAKAHWDAPYREDSWLLFGSESAGLPKDVLAELAESTYRIPMKEGIRSLNLSTSAGIVLFEAIRQIAQK